MDCVAYTGLPNSSHRDTEMFQETKGLSSDFPLRLGLSPALDEVSHGSVQPHVVLKISEDGD